VRLPHLRRVGIGALVGIVLMTLVLGLSAVVAEERPAVELGTGADLGALEAAVQTLAPTLAGGGCPDVRRAPTAEHRDAAETLTDAVRDDPGDTVASPDGTGVEIALAEVPPLVADEIDSCVLQSPRAHPGWTRLSARLR
jgi:hypothetical protein